MDTRQAGGSFCPWCGAQVPAGETRCLNCLGLLETTAAAPPPFPPASLETSPPSPDARRAGVVVAVALAVLALAGAGVVIWLALGSGKDGGAAAVTTTRPAAVTTGTGTETTGEGETTATTAGVTTTAATTTAAATTTLPGPTIYFAPPPPDPGQEVAAGYGAGELASGSGCTTPQGPPTGYWTLPDGTWFGFITDLAHDAPGGGWIVFDMGCFYEGAAAVAEAAFDGGVPHQGFYVRNEILHLFRPEVADTATVLWVDAIGDHRGVPYSAWPGTLGDSALSCPGDRCAVWVIVSGGRVEVIAEQPDVLATAAR